MTIKAILFDMDGVLINARDWHYEALNKALDHFGYFISRDSHLSTFDGLPTKDKLKILSKSQKLPIGLHDHINNLKQKYTIQLSYEKCKPTFNHRLALRELKKKYKIAVCSNSIKNTIVTLMELSGLNKYIDLIISNEEVTRSKPDPEMYKTAMKKFNVSPKECVILEDNDHGIQAAIASGGNLFKVGTPDDVQIEKIENFISSLN